MERIFLDLVNRSIAAGWLVLAVAVLRLAFRRMPKKYFVVLWALVAVRLLLPFSVESGLSLIPSRETVPQEVLTMPQPELRSRIPALDRAVNPVLGRTFAPAAVGVTGTVPAKTAAEIAAAVWTAGLCLMLLYAFITWLRLRLRVRVSLETGPRVRICDYVDTPFILGVFRPVIYLPSALSDPDRACVLAHEKAHISRRDHLWKPLGFLLLAVFWFNPLMWVAYILLCRDIEYACDEKVLEAMEGAQRKRYASALLSCSVPHRMITAAPLAFGETGVKGRIRNVLRYKKATFAVIAAAVLICVVCAACFLTDPQSDGTKDDPAKSGQESIPASEADPTEQGTESDTAAANTDAGSSAQPDTETDPAEQTSAAAAPTELRDVLTGELRYTTVRETRDTEEGGYELVRSVLYAPDGSVAEESTDSTYGLCLGRYVIKENFAAMAGDDPEVWMAGTCLYDPIEKKSVIDGVSLLAKLTDDRAVAVDARAHIMGLLNENAEMVLPYAGEIPAEFQGVQEDGTILCTTDQMNNEVVLDQDLRPVDGASEGPLSMGEREALYQYVTGLLAMTAADSTVKASAEDYVSVNGYIVAKNFELRREAYRKAFAPGITDLRTGVIMGEVMEAEDGVLHIKAYATAAFTFGEDHHAIDTFTYTVCMDRRDGSPVFTDIIDNSGYDYELQTDLKELRQAWVPGGNKYTDRSPKEIDYVLEEIYDRHYGGNADPEQYTVSYENRPEAFSEEDFDLAVDAVIRHMGGMRGLTLQEISYDAEWEQLMAQGASAWRPGRTIILKGSWKSGDRSEAGNAVNPNSVYDNWSWFVQKNGAGGWYVRDEGY